MIGDGFRFQMACKFASDDKRTRRTEGIKEFKRSKAIAESLDLKTREEANLKRYLQMVA